ncbi:MAG: hypothetical protein KKD18_06240 [Nanoarchaeota archaeon]|nr:hypothetical protein [Nanoarchaeota archaeon]
MKNKQVTRQGATTLYCHNCGKPLMVQGGGVSQRASSSKPCPHCKEAVHSHCAEDGCYECKDRKDE